MHCVNEVENSHDSKPKCLVLKKMMLKGSIGLRRAADNMFALHVLFEALFLQDKGNGWDLFNITF